MLCMPQTIENKMEEQVVLVSEQDEIQGFMGKTEAHENGLLHRAISIIIFNKNREMLIQQRAFEKYHWKGIWSNAVCTHPRQNETYKEAAERRLFEELGFNTPLEEMFHFIYKAKDEESGLTEHELDHVFVGEHNGEIPFNTAEVNDIKWLTIPELLNEIETNPQLYSFWFKIILKEMYARNLLQ